MSGPETAVKSRDSHWPTREVPKTPNAGDLGLIPGQGTRSRMPQLRVHMPQLKRSRTQQQRSLVPQLRPNSVK